MKTILFFDPVCPNPYTMNTLNTKSLGGTEASCLRITTELAKRGYNVILEQLNRTESESLEGVLYSPLNITTIGGPDTVITLRDAGHYIANKKRFPNAKHYLWMHDVVSDAYRGHMLYHLQDQSAHMICVSDWHKTQITESLMPEVQKGNIRVTRIYGPLAEYCVKDSTTVVDKNKLIFFSSPHKGLDNVLKIFTMLHKVDPDFRLYLSNPGYFKDQENIPEGVINLGSIPHHSILIDHVRTALCTFYPNTSFAETFGLVLAESNAVGTPVIAHPIGTTREVLFHPAEVMDCNNHEAVIKRVMDWKAGQRPIVRGKAQYTLKEVVNHWEKMI